MDEATTSTAPSKRVLKRCEHCDKEKPNVRFNVMWLAFLCTECEEELLDP